MDKIKVSCEMEVTLKVIGGKYKPLILYILIDNGPKRFTELKREMPQISQKTLTNQLKELQKDQLVSRHVFQKCRLK